MSESVYNLIPGDDNSNLMIPRCDEENRQGKNLITGLNVNESETSLSEKIANYSRLYPALHENIGQSWFLMLENQFTLAYFDLLSQFLVRERRKYTVFPPEDEVWSWTRMCSVKDVKIIIVGRQPYTTGEGHGLSYSMRLGSKPTDTVLNIFKELQNDIRGFVAPPHAYLVGWARQGVLLLNYILTVRSHATLSHVYKGWELLTVNVLRYFNVNTRGMVFIFWGALPQWKTKFVNLRYHYVLKAPHPHRNSANRGFFGCKHFSLCNKILIAQGEKPINWSYLPSE